MKKLLVEIQASHVGIGKTTFCEKLNYPWVDDCINLVESDPPFYYEGKRNVFESNRDNEKFREFSILIHAAALLEQLTKYLGDDWIIVTSRSPLISNIQFSKYSIDWKPLAEFYCKRLNNLKVDRVLILDYGSSIQANETFLKTGYERMMYRGRYYELNAFDSFENYCKFFEKAEEKKKSVIEMFEREPEFYDYRPMPFHNFNQLDVDIAREIISECKRKLEL